VAYKFNHCNFSSPTGYILGSQKSKRFDEKISTGVPPNYYFRRVHDDNSGLKEVQNYVPFNSKKGSRFGAAKVEFGPTIGSYSVSEDVGRQVKHWRRAPGTFNTVI